MSTLVELFVDGVWEDVTQDVRSVSTQRGTTQTSGVVRTYEAGTCAIVLNSVARRYDPVARPDLLPGTPVRVSFDGGAGLVRVFTGELDEVDVDFSRGSTWSWVTLRCTDAVSTLARSRLSELSVAVGAGDTVAQRIGRIADAVGWPVDRRDITAGGVALIGTTYNESAWVLMNRASAADPGDLWINPDGELSFRPFASTISAPTSATFGYDGDRLNDARPVNDRERLANRITYARTGEAVVTIDDTDSQTRYTAGVPWVLEDTDLPHVDQDDADDWARINLLAQSVPEFRFDSITVVMTGNQAVQQSVLGLDISSRIQVVVRPPGGGDEIRQDAWVRGIAHSKGPGVQWTTTLALASATRFNFVAFGAELDRTGFAPGLTDTFTGGRYMPTDGELVKLGEWQSMADQAVYRLDSVGQFAGSPKGAFAFVAGRGFVFFNGTTWLRPGGS